jgi:NAD(P)-dependent dehydrogenase (short-subunit alcohol dehydrogenase family)
MKDLKGKVVVITGGSGGLGRAAAVQFAAAGSTVMVAARREAALLETVRICRAAGGRAFHQVTDVTNEEQVRSLAEHAAMHTGRIDVWINNAGATLFGAIDDGPFEAHRRVIETNLFGAIFGARAVLPFLRQQKQGVIINVGSVLSKIGQPFVPSYVISKFGLHGLSEALRADLADLPEIHVCTLYPYAVNTQHFESGANYVGWDAHAMPPAQTPEKVAHAMLELAMSPRRERYVPRSAVFGLALHVLMPRTVERLVHDALSRWHFGTTPQSRTAGNLFHPVSESGAVHGKRPPQVTTPRLLLWTIARLFTLPVEGAESWLRRLRGRWALTPRVLELEAGPVSASQI